MKRLSLLLLFAILAIALFLRTYDLRTTPPGLYPDEAMNGNNALEALHTGQFKVFYPENNGREGLLIDVQAFFLKFFGVNEPWVLRLPSALFGILTVLGIYFLTEELFSKNVGLLSAFLLATSFWHINFSRISFRAILAPFFLVWALYFFLKAIRSQTSQFSIPHSLLAGILYGLGFYTYIAYRVTPLLFLLFIPFFARKTGFWRAAAIFIVATFVVGLPIGIYFLKHPADFLGRTSELSVFGSTTPLKNLGTNVVKTVGMLFVRGDHNWRHNYSGRPELFWPVGILFLIGTVLGIRRVFRQDQSTGDTPTSPFSFFLLFSWLIVATLPVVISNEGIPHALRSILMISPIFVLAAVGGNATYAFLKRYIWSFWLPLTTVIFLSLLVFEAYSTYFLLWAPNLNTAEAFNANYVAIGRQINMLPKELPKYVVVEATGVDVRGIPMPAQTVMFITDTFSPDNQKIKNVYYVLPGQESNIPPNTIIFYLK